MHHKCSFLIRCLWGQPRPQARVPTSACTSSNIFDEWPSEEHSDHTELELPLQSFAAVQTSNFLPLFSCERMCFVTYKGPQHWLNHLFRNLDLQFLVAMLTSFSNAPGAPGGAVSVLPSEPQRWAGTVLPPLLLGPPVVTHHFTRISVLPLSLSCSTSGMRLLPNAGIKEGGSSLSVCYA